MSLYYGERIQHIKKMVDSTTNELILLTAYCRTDALKEIIKNLKENVRLSVIVRFDKQDVIAGASDLDLLNYVSSKKGILYRNQKLHSKLFLSDKKSRIYGSANITGRGLGMAGEFSNIETISQREDCDLQDWIFANDVIRNSQIVTTEMITEMQEQVDKHESVNWDEDKIAKFANIPSGIFVGDFPFTARPNNLMKYRDPAVIHDYSIFSPNTSSVSDISELRNGFANSVIIRWFENLIGDQTLSFGNVTAAIHSSLLDDPLPYRREIKDLQTNLYSWINIVLPDKYKIWVSEGGHSQLIARVK